MKALAIHGEAGLHAWALAQLAARGVAAAEVFAAAQHSTLGFDDPGAARQQQAPTELDRTADLSRRRLETERQFFYGLLRQTGDPTLARWYASRVADLDEQLTLLDLLGTNLR